MVDIFKPLNLLVSDDFLHQDIESLEAELYCKYSGVFETNDFLTRKVVSFQANKDKPGYRWYKFKEAFSTELVDYFLDRYEIFKGKILDPFAGSGTALFNASARGLNADGIELLPLAQQLIDTRIWASDPRSHNDLDEIDNWILTKEWETEGRTIPLPTIRISENAYPLETKNQMERYLFLINNQFNENQRRILFFALLCILEDISYTRKDGQYLRWDYRANRSNGSEKQFEKSKISEFSSSIQLKVAEIVKDVSFYQKETSKSKIGLIRLFKESNLSTLPELNSNSYDVIVTSPPYCNRYDYTRTYALELALLGLDDKKVINLRQEMLSSTVENRHKELLELNKNWKIALNSVNNQQLLQAILQELELLRTNKQINNSGIPRMVRGYFEEMGCIIFECFRVLKPGARMIVVNDNVRYEGVSIPVDLILSDIAQSQGFSIESIQVLQNKKGNSSQQMGKHGRDALRKCVYVWRKP